MSDTLLSRWTAELAIDMPAIDGQHIELIDLLADLHHSLSADDGQALRLLDDFVLLAHMHFAAEEAVMQYRQYPHFLAHQARHASLLEEIRQLQANVVADRVPLSLALIDFLQMWLVEHIRTADRRLGLFLKTGGFDPV